MQYKGFEVAASAQAMPSGLYAANLTIEHRRYAHGASFTFDALDHFFERDHAIAYAARWARLWIDQRSARRKRG